MAKSGYSFNNRVKIEEIATNGSHKVLDLGKGDCGKVYYVTEVDNNITINLPSSSVAVGKGWNVELNVAAVGPNAAATYGYVARIQNGDDEIAGSITFFDKSQGGGNAEAGLIYGAATTGSFNVWTHASASTVTFMSDSDGTTNGRHNDGVGTGYAGTKIRLLSLGAGGWLVEGTVVISSSLAGRTGHLAASAGAVHGSGGNWMAIVNQTPFDRTVG